MTDDEIVDSIRDRHDIPLATGIYRKAHLDLVSMAREEERARIVAWLRDQDGHGYDTMRADCIEAGEHLK